MPAGMTGKFGCLATALGFRLPATESATSAWPIAGLWAARWRASGAGPCLETCFGDEKGVGGPL